MPTGPPQPRPHGPPIKMNGRLKDYLRRLGCSGCDRVWHLIIQHLPAQRRLRCRSAAISRCRTVAISQCRDTAVPRYRTVAISQCRDTALSQCRNAHDMVGIAPGFLPGGARDKPPDKTPRQNPQSLPAVGYAEAPPTACASCCGASRAEISASARSSASNINNVDA